MDLSFSLDDIRELDGALCFNEGHDPALWHPEDIEGKARNFAARAAADLQAKAICNRCPVRTRCLTQALENNEQHGIWGGMTPEEQAALKDGAA